MSLIRHFRLLPLLTLLLVPVFLFLPSLYLNHGFFWGNADMLFYNNVYVFIRDSLLQGELFPRWSSAANVGLGSAAMYGYAPGAYWLTTLVNLPLLPFGPSLEFQYLFGIYASQVVGAWLMYAWLRRQYGIRTAWLGAVIYTLIPYKFLIIYLHVNLAQCWSIALLPLWFMGAERIATNRGMITYAAGAALAFYCHPLTVIGVGPFALAYAYFCAKWNWRAVLMPVILANLLAAALVSSYVVASLVAAPWLQVQQFIGGKFNPLNNLNHIDDYIGLYMLIVLWLVWKCRRMLPEKRAVKFWAAVVIILFVIATPLSYPLWATLPFMAYIQFPFARLQPGMAVATTLLCVMMLAHHQRKIYIAVGATLLVFILLCGLRLELNYKRNKYFAADMVELIHRDLIMFPPQFLTRWNSWMPVELWADNAKWKAMPAASLKDGKGSAEITNEQNGELEIKTNGKASGSLTLKQSYIPAWKATLDGEALPLMPSAEGFITADIPAGDHTVLLAITKSPLERMADMLSIGAILLSLILWFPWRKTKTV